MKIQIIIFLLIIILILSICLIITTSINYNKIGGNVLKHGGGINELRTEIRKVQLHHNNELTRLTKKYNKQHEIFQAIVANYIDEIQESNRIDDSIKQQLVENIYKALKDTEVHKSDEGAYKSDEEAYTKIHEEVENEIAESRNKRIEEIKNSISKAIENKTISIRGGGLSYSQVEPLIVLINKLLRDQNSASKLVDNGKSSKLPQPITMQKTKEAKNVFKSHNLEEMLRSLLNEQFFIDAETEFDGLTEGSTTIYAYIISKIKTHIESEINESIIFNLMYKSNNDAFQKYIDNIYDTMKLSATDLLYKIDTLQKSIQAQDSELGKTLDEILETQNELTQAQNKIAELTRQLKNVYAIYSKILDENNQLLLDNKQIAELKSQLQLMSDKKKQLSDNNRQLSDDNNRLSDDNNRLSDDNNRLSDDNNRLSDDNKQLDKELHKFQEIFANMDTNNMQLTLETLKTTNSNLDRDLKELNKNNLDLNRTLREKDIGINTLIKEINEKDIAIAKIKGYVSKYNSLIASRTKQDEDMKSEIAKLKKENESLKIKRSEFEFKELEKKLDELLKEREELLKENQDNKIDYAFTERVISENTKLKKSIESLKSTHSNDEIEWNSLLKTCKKSENNLIDANKKLQTEIQELNNNIDEITKEVKSLNNVTFHI
jgi:chromosome segregation ATPase